MYCLENERIWWPNEQKICVFTFIKNNNKNNNNNKEKKKSPQIIQLLHFIVLIISLNNIPDNQTSEGGAGVGVGVGDLGVFIDNVFYTKTVKCAKWKKTEDSHHLGVKSHSLKRLFCQQLLSQWQQKRWFSSVLLPIRSVACGRWWFCGKMSSEPRDCRRV